MVGGTYITTKEGQEDAVTIFVARLCCRMPSPCSVCLGYVREAITARAYPALKVALLQAVKNQDINAGFGALLLEAGIMDPSPGKDPPV